MFQKMKNKQSSLLLLISCFYLISSTLNAQEVEIINDNSGSKIIVDGEDFMIKGMNWDYVPIGQNYSYSLWNQTDDFIIAALENEMPLLKSMGINTIRHYVGIPPRWVQYIYETYGIYTVVNHPLGRYGLTIDGVWVPVTDYSDEKTRALLKAEIEALVDEFNNSPGMLFWLLGNENNYGLTWTSAETEAFPEGERQSAKARFMYSLFNETIEIIKAKDKKRPVAMANGDLQYIDIIAEEIKNLDIFGSNVYRGISARDAFQVVKEKLGIPLLFTEFGADAFNAKTLSEDQSTQARYLIGQWKEIYEQSYGKGRVGNAVGGLTFQFSDGWWKYKQDENLDVHDINASWPNGGYQEDYVEGENNMNEEWWGICAKGFPDAYGYYELYPRAAYYALQKAYLLDPYDSETTLEKISKHFSTISAVGSAIEAKGNQAALASKLTSKVRVKSLQIQLETINTGGNKIRTPSERDPEIGYPTFKGFDRLESYYTEFEAKPSANVRGNLTLSYIGNVPENPIDEIFYENRGRVQTVQNRVGTEDGTFELQGIERLKVYNASVNWEDRWFSLNAFYRTGHYHWGYEGDFFGLYREANYGPNIDVYNGEAPYGMEITGKKDIRGLKIAFGPELWWGANPTVITKYQRNFGAYTATAMYQRDIDDKGQAVTSSAVPIPKTRIGTLHLETKKGNLNIEVGGIWSGSNKVGQPYDFMGKFNGVDTAFTDSIENIDALGGKIKLMYQKGKINWYLEGAIRGLVADGGPTKIQTFSGWWLKDHGMGNTNILLTGLSTRFGNLEVAPNFLWQKPIEGPMPNNPPQNSRLRNVGVERDPFAVRANREMTAFELILTYDPTPATWMYHWDSDVKEDAKFAATLGLIYKDMPTNMDAANFFAEDGVTLLAFTSSTPARDLYEVYARIVSKPKPGVGIVANLYAAEGEPNGFDPRLIIRKGADVRFIYGRTKLQTILKINDWGPYDYHKDFNFTYPAQYIVDLSTVSGIPAWFDVPETKIGIRATYRTLDNNSLRYCPGLSPVAGGGLECDPTLEGLGNGNEWEIRTYLHFNVGM